MRVRPIVVLGGVLVAAVLAAVFVVVQLPREGQVSPLAAAPAPAAPPSSLADPPAAAGEGVAVVRVTAGGEPQGTADVRLYRAIGGEDPGWRRAGSGRTGADGLARVPSRPGAYLVAVRAPGLATGVAELIRAPGAEATHVEVALAPPAALDGVVRVRGAGTPVAARVTLVPAGARVLTALDAPPEESVSVVADGDGRFSAEGLAPGTWTVLVGAPGLHPVRVERVAVPRAAPLAVELEPLATLSGEVALASGRPATGATVRAVSRAHAASAIADASGRFVLAVPAGEYALLAAAPGEAGALDAAVAVGPGGTARGLALRLGPAAVLDGVAVRADGAPAAGADVVLLRHDAGGRVARTAAGADGRFTLRDVAPGAYDLSVSAAGASPARLGGVTLAAGQRFPVTATLAATGAIEGAVADPAGHPLSGARVRVVSRGDGLERTLPLEVRSDFDGRYRIDGLEAGRAELVASEEGALVGDARAVRVAPGRAVRMDFFVAPAGVLAGRVVADGKRPPLGTAVVAVPLRAGLGTSQVARTLADASGNYGLVVPAGEYRVHAAPSEAASADLRVPPAFVRVEPRLTTRLDLTLAAAPVEEGTEISIVEPGGAPSAGAIVTVSRPDDPRIALALTAGEDGRVRLAPGLGLGDRPVTLRARNGGRAGAYTGPIPASGEVVVTLAPGAAVDGVVRAGGRAVKGFTLEVTSQPTPEGWRTVDVHRFTGDRFALGDLPGEPLRLSVVADDGRRGEALVRLAAGESRGLEIVLSGSPAGR
ncbi:carboxypeptidase regulatory-like domain-containing protein [Anaeromyxobacter oryzae]|uniref:Alpha-amylase n=1 Tax=Anaeromyxobacter oryzae TaxID=2918170 RepID=A0ABM7WX09_9BACT|nr:carboxypeptidase-like regulatory domain-containing protein [Anaeromyxobacter oryzae]BDG03984.1 hypothetical protein AMOR_29800 [Anaeromyxobacter oryzae]